MASPILLGIRKVGRFVGWEKKELEELA